MIFFGVNVVKVPEIMEKIVEKLAQVAGLDYLPINEVNFGIRTNIELSEEQFNELINMLRSVGFKFDKMAIGGDNDIMEIYRNEKTHEVIAVDYIKSEKHVIGNMIYYWRE